MRFLTCYPQRLTSGKNAPWYFLARLTRNNPHQDIGLGDRLLAIWQGSGYYHFTTNNDANPNVVQNLNFPEDIEGLWTFLYYSYSLPDTKAVAFVKFGDAAVRKLDFPNTRHPPVS